MSADRPRQRTTFRHGNVPESLLEAALKRLETQDATSLNLRELARDIGVDHRAVYRHFADKESLLAAISQRGWNYLGHDMASCASENIKDGEIILNACGVGFILFAKRRPYLFHLMSGSRLNVSGDHPDLDLAMFKALAILQQGFRQLGRESNEARARAALYASALQGIAMQIINKRLRISRKRTNEELVNICQMLVNGFR